VATPRAETLGRRESLLLDVELPGRVFRYTSGPQPITVTNAAGSSFLYLPGFSRVEVAREAGSTSSGPAIQIGPQDGDSWPLLWARGHRFELMRATVRHHYEGQVLEAAEVYERGRAIDPSWGNDLDPLTFKIERQLTASGSFPPPTHRIDDSTHTGPIDPEVYGAVYPEIFGFPGRVGGSVPAPTTPAYLVRFDGAAAGTNRWLIANGRVHAVGLSVVLYNITTGDFDTLTVQEDQDLLGQWYSYVDSSAWSANTIEGDEYRVAWSLDGGGIWNATRTAPLRGGLEISLYLLQTYAPHIRVDVGRMEAQGAILDAYKFDFGTTDVIDVWPFIAGNFLPILPAEIVESSEGIYLQARRLDAGRVDVVGERFDSTPIDGNIERVSRMSGSGSDVANRITLRYGRGGEDQRFLRSVTIDGQANGATIPSYRCAESQRRFEDPDRPGSGVRPLVLESKVVYDDSTASQIVRDKALELALPPVLVKLQGGTMWDSVDVNDPKLWKASDLHIDDVVVIVRRKGIIEDGITFTVLVVEAPYGVDRVTE
jgi:hypothetical protein